MANFYFGRVAKVGYFFVFDLGLECGELPFDYRVALGFIHNLSSFRFGDHIIINLNQFHS